MKHGLTQIINNMQGLSTTMDFSPLIGREFLNVSISKNHIHYSFVPEDDQPDLKLGIESTIIFSDSQEEIVHMGDYHLKGDWICRLIGQKIEKASRRDDGGLSLVLSKGLNLEILNENPMYEALQIYIGNKVFVA